MSSTHEKLCEEVVKDAEDAIEEVLSSTLASSSASITSNDSDDNYEAMNLSITRKPEPILIPEVQSVSASSIDFVEPVQFMFEHQRWYLLGGWRELKGIWAQKNDPPTYTSCDVTACYGPWDDEEEEFLSDEWKIVEGEYTEEDGWISAADWPTLGGGQNAWGQDTGCQVNENGRIIARSGDRVRRRLWKRQTKSNQEEDISVLDHKVSPRTIAAVDSNTAKLAFFEALSKLLKKEGVLALLDGSAWIRVVRRDVAHYKEWVKAKVLAVMRVGGGGGWLLAYPSIHKSPRKARNSARVLAPSSPESLRELCCGALHACAAYGYPMAKGWLGSVKAGASLFTWRRLNIINKDAIRGVDDATHSDSARQVVGPLFDIITANWSSATFMPVWYLGVDHALKWIVLSVRGTLNSTDMLTDVTVEATPLGGGHVHRGVLEAALRVFAAIVEPLSQARKSWPSYRLVCCGHSLGGSIAALTCSMLRGIKEGNHATCIAIGPAACVSQDTDVSLHTNQDGSFGDFTTSVILGMDPAPRLSVSNVHRLIKDLNDKTVAATAASAAASAGASLMGVFRSLNSMSLNEEFEKENIKEQEDNDPLKTSEDRVSEDRVSEEGGGGGSGGVLDDSKVQKEHHTMQEVVDMAEKEAEEEEGFEKIELEEGAEVSLVAPGCLLHIDDEVELASSPSVVAFPVHSNEYDRIPLSYNFMTYHLPQRYLAALLAAAEIPSIKHTVEELHFKDVLVSPTSVSPISSTASSENDGGSGSGGTCPGQDKGVEGNTFIEGSTEVSTEALTEAETCGISPEEVFEEINEAQFMIRFEHLSSAFDIPNCSPQSPVNTNV